MVLPRASTCTGAPPPPSADAATRNGDLPPRPTTSRGRPSSRGQGGMLGEPAFSSMPGRTPAPSSVQGCAGAQVRRAVLCGDLGLAPGVCTRVGDPFFIFLFLFFYGARTCTFAGRSGLSLVLFLVAVAGSKQHGSCKAAIYAAHPCSHPHTCAPLSPTPPPAPCPSRPRCCTWTPLATQAAVAARRGRRVAPAT